jgi:hypothetical protein
MIELYRYSCKLKKCKTPKGPWESSRSYAEQQRREHIRIFHPSVVRMQRATFKLEKV